jgi:hypothetical protein
MANKQQTAKTGDARRKNQKGSTGETEGDQQSAVTVLPLTVQKSETSKDTFLLQCSLLVVRSFLSSLSQLPV